jgi:hypothetical protein
VISSNYCISTKNKNMLNGKCWVSTVFATSNSYADAIQGSWKPAVNCTVLSTGTVM